MTQPVSKHVHHLLASGTLDQLAYTACGWDPDGLTCTKFWDDVTCPNCLRVGPRRAPSLPKSGMETHNVR